MKQASEGYGAELTQLGNPGAKPGGLETFPCTQPGLEVTLECTEFTCRCPVTKQPDWATVIVRYVADELLVESKSVKLFLETYRDTGVFHEHLAQELLDAFVLALSPRNCEVEVRFNTRGGIAITATASWWEDAARFCKPVEQWPDPELRLMEVLVE